MLHLSPTFSSLQQVRVAYSITLKVVYNSLSICAFLLQKDATKFSGSFVNYEGGGEMAVVFKQE